MMPRAIYSFLTQLPWLNLERAPKVQDFEGRVLLLDFWTFCCVNCLHVLPELHRLEQEFGDKLTVLGIHSAKFENEKDDTQIVQAIEKYGIQHPVANDSNFLVWKALGVNAWPSFALVGADGRMVELTSGEGVYAKLRDRIAAEIEQSSSRAAPAPFPAVVPPRSESELRFPGKLLWDERGRRLFVADTEHHRIRVFDEAGRELAAYGSGLVGLKDGPADLAQFHSPQGLALGDNVLFVADTENHALRRIDLATGEVRTLFGNGKQSRVAYWREALTTELNSPWALAWLDGELIVAMAGAHQLYKLTRDDRLERFVGSGVENLVDGNARRACLAQTSGLSTTPDGVLWIADAETSALRKFEDGEVRTLVGTGLFDFGFRDGRGAPEESGALLQHPLDVAASADGLVYVADAYNHAIRVFDTATAELRTLCGGKAGHRDGPLGDARFREPSGLALAGARLFVADTNNHAVRVIDLEKCTVSTWELTPLARLVVTDASSFLPNLELERTLEPAAGPFRFSWTLPTGFKLNPKAPSRVSLRNPAGETQRWDPRAKPGAEIEIPFAALAPGTVLEATLYPCPADGDGECRVVSARIHFGPAGTTDAFSWKLG
jgi:thiol-disulfide isomerase/thioredoxin